MLRIFKGSTDYSLELESFTTDEVDLVLQVGESIDWAHYKPINAVWVEQLAPVEGLLDVVFEYWNGTAWAALGKLKDYTKKLKQSGWLIWSRNQLNEAKKEEHGLTLFWYRARVVAIVQPDPAPPSPLTEVELTLKGINLVFSQDADLLEEFPGINDLLPEGQPSFIGFHQSAMKDIVTDLRRQGKFVSPQDVMFPDGIKRKMFAKNLDQFDLLDFSELREAAKFKALEKIMSWRSDATDDKFKQKADDFSDKYGAKMDLFLLSIDTNDDGLAQEAEVADNNITVVGRM